MLKAVYSEGFVGTFLSRSTHAACTVQPDHDSLPNTRWLRSPSSPSATPKLVAGVS